MLPAVKAITAAALLGAPGSRVSVAGKCRSVKTTVPLIVLHTQDVSADPGYHMQCATDRTLKDITRAVQIKIILLGDRGTWV